MASIEEMYNQIYAEVQGHIPKLASIRWLWREARTWLDEQAKLLRQQANQLVTQDHWPDAAGQQFLNRVNLDLATIRSWTEPGVMTGPNRVTTSNVFDTMNELDNGLWAAQRAAERLVLHYNGLSDEDKGKQRQDIERKIADEITKLVPLYQAAMQGMRNAVGLAWTGPRASTSGQGQPGPATNRGPAATSPSASPSPTEPQPQEPAPTEPESPKTTDPLKDALDAAPGALTALSQAMQSAQQLLGGGTGSPSPTPLSPVGPLGPGDSLSPMGLAEQLARLDDSASGLPSLAGGGVDPVGGSGGVGGGAASPVAPVSPASSGGVGNAAFPAAVSLSANGSGGASTSGSAGAMPPAQQQPQQGGARTGSGIKPGAAEHAATGRSRDRKSGATPGVPLLGRSGRGRPVNRTTEAAPAPRRWDRENDTVQLLDEELWQVKQEDSGPRYRAGQ